jgi:hypothetical protein
MENARRTLRRTGVWCTVINGAWLIFPLVFALRFAGLGMDLWMVIGFSLLMTVCFQASFLTLVASYVLPRREEDRVQVTEDLRL